MAHRTNRRRTPRRTDRIPPHAPRTSSRSLLVSDRRASRGRIRQEPHTRVLPRGRPTPVRVRLPLHTLLRLVPPPTGATRRAARRARPDGAGVPTSTREYG